MEYAWWLCLPGVAVIIYWHYTKTFSYWKKKGVHYIEPTILFGNIKDRMLFRKSFHEFQLELYKKFHGYRYAGFFEGRRPSLMIRDPELIRYVLIRDFEHFTDRPTLRLRHSPYIENMLINLKGQRWKNVRAVLTPTFTTGKLRAMENLVLLCGEQLHDYLYKTTDGNNTTEFEMKDLFGRFTMDVIASCAFGVECDSLKQPDAEFVKIASQFNDIPLLHRIGLFAVILLIPQLAKFLPLSFFNTKTMDFLADVISRAKKVRENSTSHRRNDFLQLVLDASHKEPGASVLDDDTIIAQAVLFLLAGFETSSTLLTFASYELALNQDVQDAARKEVNEVLERNDGSCPYEALQDMPYLENVLFETLRKYPPVARVDRTCTTNYTLPGTDVTLDVGYAVAIPVMGLHYDPQYFPEPDLFNPDRFLPEEKLKRSPYVYMPFGAGPRNCIGTRFALMSTKIAMVHLLKGFVVKPSPKTEVPFQYTLHTLCFP
ncbi:cytochrome P450 9e2 isoform X2 [Anabrus simplex]|uniref:cytochrome P450 9e2 isoform X2 n=1 Tax=Anabrus simplex TaxID=316456 RepID=UPI0034DD79DF